MTQIEFKELEPKTFSNLAKSGIANLSNALTKRGLRNTFLLRLKQVDKEQPRLIGPAFTVRFIPAREDLDTMELYARDDGMHRRAIEECPEGAVMVMATGGDIRASCMGDMMALRLQMRGVAGVVTDGGFRDTPGIIETGLPCFEKTPSGPATPLHLSPVAFNDPVGCAGVAIYPGDIIVGDGEGIVCIPIHLVNEVAQEAAAAADYEEFAAQHVRNGRSLFGLFPSTAESRIEFEAWVANGRPKLED